MIADCPVCNIKGCLEVKSKTEIIPYFGEIMESTVKCQECGFKHSDTICLEIKEPVKYSLSVDKNKMNVRVVKSQSATITIPELGLKVELVPNLKVTYPMLKVFLNVLKTQLKQPYLGLKMMNHVRMQLEYLRK
jgi:ZPR1 zinc finger protein